MHQWQQLGHRMLASLKYLLNACKSAIHQVCITIYNMITPLLKKMLQQNALPEERKEGGAVHYQGL